MQLYVSLDTYDRRLHFVLLTTLLCLYITHAYSLCQVLVLNGSTVCRNCGGSSSVLCCFLWLSSNCFVCTLSCCTVLFGDCLSSPATCSRSITAERGGGECALGHPGRMSCPKHAADANDGMLLAMIGCVSLPRTVGGPQTGLGWELVPGRRALAYRVLAADALVRCMLSPGLSPRGVVPECMNSKDGD
jgi:hypothetical protein